MDTVGLVIGIVLALIGIVLTWISIRSKKPLYAVRGMNLVSADAVGRYKGLQVQFAYSEVKQVTVTNICLWNGGRETIRKGDIPTTDPLRIVVCEGVEILATEVIRARRKVLGAQMGMLPDDDQCVFSPWPAIQFEFLDYGDWLHIQVLHTGKNPDDCWVDGTIMGCSTGIRRIQTNELALRTIVALHMLPVAAMAVTSLFLFLTTGNPMLTILWLAPAVSAGLVIGIRGPLLPLQYKLPGKVFRDEYGNG